ncbi:MAG: class I SAM-dependent methyltransferase [Polyangiaceae bacterium]
MSEHEFTPGDARRFYDRFGAKQDLQFYENRALDRLLAQADFEHASSVFELGCGTGRLAERLLRERLPAGARYVGVDVSTTMTRLAQERLAPCTDRATARLTDGSTRLAEPAGAFDRFVATYVLDLLPERGIVDVLGEAHRVLGERGQLCVVGMTEGTGPLSRTVCAAWKGLHSLSPRLVGGCRPVRVGDRLDTTAWRIEHDEVVTAWGVPSEVLIASRI